MSDPKPWDRDAAADFDRLHQLHLYRQRRTFRPVDATHLDCDGRRLVNFSSNNYLGLTHHPKIRQAVEQSVARDGFGSAAAPLITGYGPAHESAEKKIAAWKAAESAVLLPSGYQANLAAIQTISAIGKLGGGVRFLVDKLSHASLIDAIRGSGEPFRVFPHNHMLKLQRLLEEAGERASTPSTASTTSSGQASSGQASSGQALQVVVTESIFSMDGDAADLAGIVRLKSRHNFLLLLDEAHATGVYGPAGAGLAAELGLGKDVDVSILTLSKALGGIGGAVCGSAAFCNAVVNYGRSYLFSTGVPSAIATAGEAAIEVLQNEPNRQRRVRELAKWVRSELGATHFPVPPGDSPIVPIILGEEEKALGAAARLFEEGLLVMAVRPPTVQRGTSRLRVTLCSEHTDEELDRLLIAIKKL